MMSEDNKEDQSMKPKKRLSRKKIIMLVAILVVIAITGCCVLYFVYQSDQINRQIDSLISDSQMLQSKGDYSKAIDKLDKASNLSDDGGQKTLILIDKSAAYVNQGEYDKALEIALQAEKGTESENLMQFISNIYLLQENYSKAIEYIEKAIPLVDKNSPMSRSLIDGYRNQIKVLKDEEK